MDKLPRPSPLLAPVSKEQESRTSRTKQYIATFSATLGGMAGGTGIGWTSPMLPLLQDSSSTLPITAHQASWIGSLFALGAVFGGILVGFLVDRFGRKATVMYISGPFLLSWILVLAATRVWVLYIARFIVGLGMGAISVAAPLFVGEIAEDSVRGMLSSIFVFMICVGVLFVYAVGAAQSYTLVACSSGVIPILLFASMLWVPETPNFLIAKNKKDEAKRSLQWYRGPNCNVTKELQGIQVQVEESMRNKGSLADIFATRAGRKAFLATSGLMVFQQFSGICVVLFYASEIFFLSGSSMKPSVCAIIIGAIQVLSTCLTTILVDRAGRKILLTLSGISMATCLGMLGVYFHLKESGMYVGNISWLPLLSLTAYMVAYNIGFGPLPWVVMAEMFPPNIKGVASAACGSLCWALAFIVTKLFQDLSDVLGASALFLFFSACCIVAAIFVFFIVPETKGKSLEQIQRELSIAPV